VRGGNKIDIASTHDLSAARTGSALGLPTSASIDFMAMNFCVASSQDYLHV